MSIKDQSRQISGEHFRIMKKLKEIEGDLARLRAAGEDYRLTLGADDTAGQEAFVHLDLAASRTTAALDAMVATCGAAKRAGIRAGGPFVCPNQAVHVPGENAPALKEVA